MTNPNPQPVYYVRSDRNPSKFYLVATDAYGSLVCECPAAQFYRRPCKHSRRIVAGQVAPAMPKRQHDPLRVQVSAASRELSDLLQV